MTVLERLQSFVQSCRIVTVERAFRLDLAADAAWAAVTDTNRLNWVAGLMPIHIDPVTNRSAARYRVSTRIAGFPMVYDEEPYEWVHNRFFKVTRKILQGSPARLIQMQYWLSPVEDARKTQVRLRCMILPRWWWLAPFLRPMVDANLRKLQAAMARVPAGMDLSSQTPHPKVAPTLHDAQLWASLPCSPGARSRLRHILTHQDDIEVAALRPYEYAQRWNMPREVVLSLFLTATAHGILCARLEAMCPSCRLGVGPLTPLPHCHLCDLALGAPAEWSCEVLFAPDPKVREVTPVSFCPGGPSRTPHVIHQVVVPHGGVAELQLPEATGTSYRLFERGGVQSSVVADADGANRSEVRLGVRDESPVRYVQPGGMLILRNPHGYACHVKLETYAADQAFVTLFEVIQIARAHEGLFAASQGVLDGLKRSLMDQPGVLAIS